MDKNNHAFVIMTNGTSNYLEDCIVSLKKQIKKSQTIIVTSSITNKVKVLSKKYSIKFVSFKYHKNIGNDWNRALHLLKNKKWITLVHQDDIYHTAYYKKISCIFKNYRDASIIFTNYAQIKKERIEKFNLLLIFKKLILYLGFWHNTSIKKKIRKKIILLFGSPIPCPSVTYNIKKIKEKPFNENFKVNLDWKLWLDLSDNNRDQFVWVKDCLLFHRIHSEAVTGKAIKSGLRESEDRIILEKIWPKWIVKKIFFLNKIAYLNNLK